MAGARLLTRYPYNPVPEHGKLTLSSGVITDVTRLAGVEGDGAAYPDSSVGVWPAATNIVRNSNCTTNTTDWGGAGASFSRITTDYKFNGACAQAITAGSGTGEGMQVGGAVAGNYFALSAATAYSASVWVKADAGATISMALSQYTAAAAFITDAIIVNFVATGDWQQVTCTGTTDATCAQGRVRILTRTSAQAITIKAGGVQVETGSIATPSIHTDGGTASRSLGSIRMPASLLDETQMWVAIRKKAAHSSGSNPFSPNSRVDWGWGDAGNSRLGLVALTDGIRFQRSDGATTSTASSSGTWSAGDDILLVGGATPTTVFASAKGASPTSAAHTAIPTIASTFAEILGSGEVGVYVPSARAGTVYWCATGLGLLTAADIALMNSWGNNRPLPHQFPRSADLRFLAHFYGDGTQYRWAA